MHTALLFSWSSPCKPHFRTISTRLPRLNFLGQSGVKGLAWKPIQYLVSKIFFCLARIASFSFVQGWDSPSNAITFCSLAELFYEWWFTNFNIVNLTPVFHGSNKVQWGYEYQTSLVFKWLKRGWMPNGLVFRYHLNTRQPNYLNTGQKEAITGSHSKAV